ncbi:Vps62-related protein [Actinokineospora iranica]|uniref:Vps62-related protein n=1 Tax=Actinokineospora iranica TaxID=1271860 RepID=UPI00111400A1|nr:Vps62-related protein [Actinokineospora iranica]
MGFRGMRLAVAVMTAAVLVAGCEDEAPPAPRSAGESSPAPDDAALAARFAPLVWLAGGEAFQPGDAGRFIAASELWFHELCGTKDPHHRLATEVDPARLGGRPSPYTKTACVDGVREFSSTEDLDAGRGGGSGFYLELDDNDDARRGDVGSAPVYWEKYDSGDGRTAFVYWLFYPYNQFVNRGRTVNKHEGDWERVAVRLRGAEPIGVTFWKHGEPPCLVEWGDVEQADGHPVAYSALGSHGSYHRAGGWDATPAEVLEVPIPEGAQPITDITSPGTRWPTWERARSVVDEPWWGYRGKWGSQPGRAGADGPRGPYPGRSEAVFATEPCADPLPLPTASPGPPVPTSSAAPAVIDGAYLGTWRSPEPVDQPTTDKEYRVELTLRQGALGERVGDIRYPGLECSGSLSLVEVRPTELVVAERIDAEPVHQCVTEGIVTLTRTPDGLSWAYISIGGVMASAKLVRS